MPPASGETTRIPRWLVIAAVSMAGLLLEVGYTRIISYKLWYYYTYMVIGLSLLGIGTGGVAVALSSRLRSMTTDRVVAACSLWSALSIAIGYFVIARIPIDTTRIWDYGSAGSFKNLAILGVICFALFATFIGLGIILSVLLGRAGDAIGRIYFADLMGAGFGCLLAIPLITRLGPPSVILLAALVFAVVGVATLPQPRTALVVAGSVLCLGLTVGVVSGDSLPDVEIETGKAGGPGAQYYDWGPVFRVDVVELGEPFNSALLLHDGSWGSGLHQFDGDASTLTYFDQDPRAIPFAVLDQPPSKELIIGSAGGQEILASLYYGSTEIQAVELNPVTVDLLEDTYAEYTGHLPDRPEVALHQGDGRTYLARSDDAYDLVWYVAPDSYAANNAASSGAFVLSESYLYTSEMIVETLDHLSDDGIMVVQFGEFDYDGAPNRTSRYVVTARDALAKIGAADPGRHVAVAVFREEGAGELSTIVVKRTPFTESEAAAFADISAALPNVSTVHVPGASATEAFVSQLAASDEAAVDALVAGYQFDISVVTDDAPFFWHFAPFGDVLANFFDPIDADRGLDPEDSIGERVLVLLLVIAVVYAAVFLLLPFVTVRREWSAVPAKRPAALYFAALGLGFMIYEIVMIQRLVGFLGYPTYSLTVTLAAILVFAGLGSLASRRFVARASAVLPMVVVGLGVVTLFYQFGLDGLIDAVQGASLTVRVLTALVVLAPLGLALGMFMPLGLGVVGRLHAGESYIAWSWAVNGFFSVIGAVLATMLSMTFGFTVVLYLALAVYVVAAVAFRRLAATEPPMPEPDPADEPVPATV